MWDEITYTLLLSTSSTNTLTRQRIWTSQDKLTKSTLCFYDKHLFIYQEQLTYTSIFMNVHYRI